MKKLLIIKLIIILSFLAFPLEVLAQDYYFQVPKLDVNAYWNEDGTLSIDYMFFFMNDPSGHRIEYVDVGIPNSSFFVNNISAEVDGKPVDYISESEFEGEGNDGVAIALGSNSIPPGESGSVRVYIDGINNVLYNDTAGDDYVSAVLIPTYFPKTSYGITDLTVTYHLPPGVLPEEPRWHTAPDGFPNEPDTAIDDRGRIIYRWHNPNANPFTRYEFGASFPKKYVPETAVSSNAIGFIRQLSIESIFPVICMSAIVLIIVASVFSSRNRKLKYLPPKITIEGHGIKRGLTAVEAAILLEQPLDKILTMILFSVIKKNATRVVKREPLELEILEPLPDELHQYEVDFLRAFQKNKSGRSKALQDAIVDLVKSVSNKMKGFSRKETITYYQEIIDKAWKQVETAETPEVKSESYDKFMEWTMLDKDYDDRTRDVFRQGPVIIPTWWGRYDPTYSGPSAPKTVSAPSSGGLPSSAGPSMPQLPGSSFAASIVGGAQNFASSVVGNITDFTSRITQQTNPAPKTTSTTKSWSGGGSSGGSSCVCACACACAGCACACAGGGR
jgi:hypothetical protein